jgi:hypothetical protein
MSDNHNETDIYQVAKKPWSRSFAYAVGELPFDCVTSETREGGESELFNAEECEPTDVIAETRQAWHSTTDTAFEYPDADEDYCSLYYMGPIDPLEQEYLALHALLRAILSVAPELAWTIARLEIVQRSRIRTWTISNLARRQDHKRYYLLSPHRIHHSHHAHHEHQPLSVVDIHDYCAKGSLYV